MTKPGNKLTDLDLLNEKELRGIFDELNIDIDEYELGIARRIVRDMSKGDLTLINEIMNADYKAPLAPLDEFLDNELYLGGAGKDLRPKLRQDFFNIFSTYGIYEVILAGAIGWGKNYFSSICLPRLIYEVLMLKDPQGYLGVAKSQDVYIMNLSINADHAYTELFTSVKNIIDSSPFFDQFRVRKDLNSVIQFQLGNEVGRGKLIYKPGNSTEFSTIGKSIIGGAIDEANFMQEIENSRRGGKHGNNSKQFSAAYVLYNSIMRRMKSRFMRLSGTIPGKLFIISSQSHEKDFVNKKIDKALETNNKSIYIIRYATWETQAKYDKAKRFKVGVNDHTRNSRILDDRETGEEFEKIIYPPVKFKQEFIDDFWGAMCDYAGEKFSSVHKYFARDKWAKVYDNNIQPVTNRLSIDLEQVDLVVLKKHIQHIDRPRFGHIDLAESGDSLGFGLSYINSLVKLNVLQNGDYVEVIKPMIYTDLILEIMPPISGNQIDYDKIYTIVLALVDLGIDIRKLTFDRFQSTYLMQRLRKKGIDCDLRQIDSKYSSSYKDFKMLVVKELYKCVLFDKLTDEAHDVEKDPITGKVDHTPEGCFTGDTQIKLLDGSIKTMKELKNLKNFWLYACKSDGTVVPAKAKKCWITKKVDTLMKITLDNGKIIKCTKEHRFMLRDGSYEQAQNLKINSSLMPLYTKEKLGYEYLFDNKLQTYIPTHTMVCNYFNKGAKWSNKTVNHHIDFNKHNNMPENLELLDITKHNQLHAKHSGLGKNNIEKRIKTFKQNYWQKPENKIKLKIRKYKQKEKELIRKKLTLLSDTDKRYDSPYINANSLTFAKFAKTKKGRKLRKLQSIKLNYGYWQTKYGKFKRKQLAKTQLKNALIKRMQLEDKLAYKNIKNKLKYMLFSSQAVNLFGGATKTWNRRFTLYKVSFSDNLKNTINALNKGIITLKDIGLSKVMYNKAIKCFNHKIKNIEIIKLKKSINVYDIEVPEFHNFALASGVFVHNSKDILDAACGSACNALDYFIQEGQFEDSYSLEKDLQNSVFKGGNVIESNNYINQENTIKKEIVESDETFVVSDITNYGW